MGFFTWGISAIYSLAYNVSAALFGFRNKAASSTAWQQAVSAIISLLDNLLSLLEYVVVMNAYAVNRLARAAEYSAQGTLNTFKWFADVAIPVFVYNVVGTETAERRAAIAGVIAKEERDVLQEYNERRAAIAGVISLIERDILQEYNERRAAIAGVIALIERDILQEYNERRAAIAGVIAKEEKDVKALHDQLTAAIDAVSKYAHSIPGLIDARAAAGYDPTLRARGNLLSRLLDTVAAHDPLVAGLVKDLATFAIDLAGVEDPILRVVAQFALKQVIDHLGVDTALKAMLGDLLGGILGGGRPVTLQAILGDVGNRLDALEAGQAALSPLAPEADDLHELGTLAFDAALLAYFTAAVTEPVATAADTVAVLEPVTAPLMASIRGILGV